MKTSRAVVLILLVAAVLRLADLVGVPPGLEHDEVANWLIDRDILSGRHALYFTEAYGHEAGYHYLQAAAVALLGDHALSLRLPSVFLGLLGIAASFALARRLFGQRVALINAALLAVLFWPVFFGRLGVRAISLPAVSGLAAWFFLRGLEIGPKTGDQPQGKGPSVRGLSALCLAGVIAGASVYTYMAARIVPLIFVLFVLYLLMFHRPLILRHWRGVVLFFALMAATAAPLGLWLLGHPGAEFRIAEISQPLDAMLQGDLRPVAENGLKLLGFFGWRGDPLVRQNIPGRPVFDVMGAVLFYLGGLLALWRWRRPEYAFVVIWLALSLTPSLVTADAPSSIRCINGLVVVGVFAGLAVESLEIGVRRLISSRASAQSSGERWVNALLGIWLFATMAWTVRDYYVRWPSGDDVQFVWQTALREAAAALDADPDPSPVVVAGWTPGSMDPPTMALFLRREDIPLRFVDPTQSLIIPQDTGQSSLPPTAPGSGRLVRPTALPLDPALEAELMRWGGTSEERGLFTLCRLPFPSLNDLLTGPSVTFEGTVTFLGYRSLPDSTGVSMLTYWRPAGPVEGPLHIFFHLVDAARGTPQVVGQQDGLGAPVDHWQGGDLIVQLHRIPVPAGDYTALVGIYNPETGDRWLHDSAAGPADAIKLTMVTVP